MHQHTFLQIWYLENYYNNHKRKIDLINFNLTDYEIENPVLKDSKTIEEFYNNNIIECENKLDEIASELSKNFKETEEIFLTIKKQ